MSPCPFPTTITTGTEIQSVYSTDLANWAVVDLLEKRKEKKEYHFKHNEVYYITRTTTLEKILGNGKIKLSFLR